ncbi:MAG TPA: hypothetical protein VD978_06190 [Azospirillum sp.]|nr:hypothetical protein [Azospirillum sp.]
MPRIRLHIAETWEQKEARILDAVQRWEAGELTEDADSDFGFQRWEHLASELEKDAPGMAAELLAMSEADRFTFFDTPAGQTLLHQLWKRFDFDTNCNEDAPVVAEPPNGEGSAAPQKAE